MNDPEEDDGERSEAGVALAIDLCVRIIQCCVEGRLDGIEPEYEADHRVFWVEVIFVLEWIIWIRNASQEKNITEYF